MAMRGRDDRTPSQMIRDQLVLDRMETWGEWDFLARDVPVEKDDLEASYDVLTIDLDNRRIQADIIGYDSQVKDLIHQAVEGLENDYGYLVSNLTSDDFFGRDFPPEKVEGSLYWIEEDRWKLDTTEFGDLTDNLFGYDVLSRDYEKISREVV